jgi:hypothetical protein
LYFVPVAKHSEQANTASEKNQQRERREAGEDDHEQLRCNGPGARVGVLSGQVSSD